MKQPWEWDEEDIEALIANQVQESLNLDYKRSAALDRRNPKSRPDLSKDVSAFANSAGGTLVYGVEETNNLPTGIDNGFDPADITREWIEQVINSNIQRRIDGIRIEQIELKKKAPGRVIYVVDIPQSLRAPHMASDHVYYKRYNYESIAMEEYEVRDIMNRSTVPDVGIEFTHRPLRQETYQHEYVLQITVKNIGEQIVNHFKVIFTFPLVVSKVRHVIHARKNMNFTSDSTDNYIIQYRSETVLFPKEALDIGEEIAWCYTIDNEINLKIRQLEREGSYQQVSWTLYADNMPYITGSKPFSELHDF